MPVILVTNDDGVTSDGIHALADAMKPLGDVVVVAPLQEASAIGHALTLRRPLRIETVRDGVYGVDGTPTDCVNLACAIILKRAARPRRVGHQQGMEPRRRHHLLGHRVGCARRRAARRARHCRVVEAPADLRLWSVGRCGRKGGGAVLKHGLPARCFININVPPGKPKGLRVTTQAKRNHVTKIDARTDPRGNHYYWIEEALDEYHPDSGRSDYEAVKEGIRIGHASATRHDGI